MSRPGSVVAGARRFAFLSGITATGKCSDVAAPLLHRMSPVGPISDFGLTAMRGRLLPFLTRRPVAK